MPGLQVGIDAANLPPSAKLVYLIIDECGPLSHGDLRERAEFSYSTLRGALDELEAAGVIEMAPASDARSRVYHVTEG